MTTRVFKQCVIPGSLLCSNLRIVLNGTNEVASSLYFLQYDSWKVERSRVSSLSYSAPRPSLSMYDDSEDDLSTDSSGEDLPVPRLRNHQTPGSSPATTTGHHFNSRRPVASPLQSPGGNNHLGPSQGPVQQHRYLKHGQSQGTIHPKVRLKPY